MARVSFRSGFFLDVRTVFLAAMPMLSAFWQGSPVATSMICVEGDVLVFQFLAGYQPGKEASQNKLSNSQTTKTSIFRNLADARTLPPLLAHIRPARPVSSFTNQAWSFERRVLAQ
ncbi:hypothetical protein ACFIOY_00585 [Bradyrhizobium sp. TZ2]